MAGPDDPRIPNSPSGLQSNNYFERLGLRNGASDAEVKAAFRRLAKDLHPDINPGDSSAEEKFKLIGEAYDNLMLGITAKLSEQGRPRRSREPRQPRTPENEATRKRFQELKTEALGVDNFAVGGELAETIAREFEPGDRRSDLLGHLTRRLHHLLQKQIKEHTTLESLATLAGTVNKFCDSSGGRLLHTTFFTDELDATALGIGLEMLAKTRSKLEVEQALAQIAAYPITFAPIIESPVAEGKEDAMAKIKLLKRVKEGRPRTGERLDKLVAEVNAYQFTDEKRAPLYKKQIIDIIERHRNVYYTDGVFVPLVGMSPEGVGDE